MMKRLAAVLLSTVALANPALALDNQVIVTPGSGVTLRSVDVGAGLQSMVQILGDTAGNPLAKAPGTNNASFALPIQGVTSGVPIPISGSIAVTNVGTFAVQAAQSGTWNITNVSGTVSLPTGAATAANQTNATQKTQVVDGSGNVIASTSNNLNVQCANCSGSGVSAVDEASFTAGSSLFAPAGGFFQTVATSNPLTNGQQGAWQLTANRAGHVNLRTAAGVETGVAAVPLQVTGANGTFPVTQATAASLNATVVGTGTFAVQASQSSTWTVGRTSLYPANAIPYTASATGTTAATTATLAGAAAVTTYICGFSIRANATAAATGNATVTGTVSGTMNFTQWTAPNASGVGVAEMIFSPCVPASTTNTSIAVVSAAAGTGGVASVSAWGYKL